MDIRLLSGRDCSHLASSHGELNLAVVRSSLGMKTSSTELLGLFSSAMSKVYSIDQQLYYGWKKNVRRLKSPANSEMLASKKGPGWASYLFKFKSVITQIKMLPEENSCQAVGPRPELLGD